MIVEHRLPPLERIIYFLEDTRSTRQLWLDIERGQLRELCPEQLEEQPERFGVNLFPLPPWSSAQGYELMRAFAQNMPDNILGNSAASPELGEESELQKILRSRHGVFQRYRAYLKQNPQLKQGFERFKAEYFCRYLRCWYQREFPQAGKLFSLLPREGEAGHTEFGELARESANGEHALQESGASINLLREDLVLVEQLRESAEQFQCLSGLERERRALHLLAVPCKPQDEEKQSPPEVLSAPFAALHGLYREVPWFNFLELQSPAGEAIAALYWVWQPAAHQTGQTGKRAKIVRLLCDEKYEQLAIKDYLIEEFLLRICPKLGIAAVEFCLDTASAQSEELDLLKGFSLETVATIYRCELAAGT